MCHNDCVPVNVQEYSLPYISLPSHHTSLSAPSPNMLYPPSTIRQTLNHQVSKPGLVKGIVSVAFPTVVVKERTRRCALCRHVYKQQHFSSSKNCLWHLPVWGLPYLDDTVSMFTDVHLFLHSRNKGRTGKRI